MTRVSKADVVRERLATTGIIEADLADELGRVRTSRNLTPAIELRNVEPCNVETKGPMNTGRKP
jgi:hypothetical protein